jgi:ribosomal protein L22
MGRAPKFKNVFPKAHARAFGKMSQAVHIKDVMPW